MTAVAELPTPALVLDLDRLEANLEAMAARARSFGVALRPHVKTHKSLEVAARQRRLGAHGLTVSTLYEARVFAAGGFDDLTWAFPLVPGRLAEAAELAGRVTLRLVVDSPAAVAALEDAALPLHVWLKVDCGYHRAGVDPLGPEALELARRLARSRHLFFDGLLTHSGHAYAAGDRAGVRAAARQERDVMVELAARLRAAGVDPGALSIGSTPALAAVDHLTGIDEVRPGNYALYDGTQVALGSCGARQVAVSVLATVVSRGAAHSVVDAGALALSKDAGPGGADGTCYGRLFRDYGAGELHDDRRLTALAQEHGFIDARLPVGERVRILPNHSCLTVAQFDHFEVVRGDRVLGRWKIERGRG